MGFSSLVHGQSERSYDDATRLDVVVEQAADGDWRERHSAHVFDHGDALRFRLTTNFDGFLFVSNYGSSGVYKTLFPDEQTGLDNRVEAGTELLIPATSGSFRVTDPPGIDRVFWIFSREPFRERPSLSSPSRPRTPTSEAPAPVAPRCDQTIWKSRGECIESSAGPHPLDMDEAAEIFPQSKTIRSRAVVTLGQDGSATISGQPQGPMIFELRIAHR